MRIGLVSDIHVDLNRSGGREIVTGLLAEAAAARGLDLLAIAGDISSDFELTLRTVDELERASGVRVLFVPGNHDIWNESHPGNPAWDAYAALLEHPANLARGPVALGGGWSIAGDLGWYDFAFGDPEYSLEDFERMKLGDRLWQDKVRSIWDRGTIEMHRHFLGKLDRALGDLDCSRTILLTHVVPVRQFAVGPDRAEWRYFNAFLGSPDYGRLCVSRGVRYSVSGHVHFRRGHREAGTEFLCVCLGYSREWPDPADAAGEIDRTLRVIEI